MLHYKNYSDLNLNENLLFCFFILFLQVLQYTV